MPGSAQRVPAHQKLRDTSVPSHETRDRFPRIERGQTSATCRAPMEQATKGRPTVGLAAGPGGPGATTHGTPHRSKPVKSQLPQNGSGMTSKLLTRQRKACTISTKCRPRSA